LASFRAELLKNPYYLGIPNLVGNVDWKRVGRDEMIVSAEAVAIDTSNTGKTSTAGSEIEDGEAGEPGEEELNPVQLTMVAKVSTDNCWLTPCANWKGPTEYIPVLANIKLNCLLVAPSSTLFAGDFNVALTNVTK
ncbi:hypothetical protein R3P38DRAFT_2486263, partial [Favolaschia claudopus]